MLNETKIRIPRTFFDDHMDRELPTPDYRRWRGGYVIKLDDPHLPELISDATHYATDGCDCEPGLKRAARALLATIAKEKAFIEATRPQ